MTETETSQTRIIDIEDLSFDRGAHLLINRALAKSPIGEKLGIRGRAPELSIHLRSWCRAQGHEIIWHNIGSDRTVSELVNSGAEESGSPIAWIIRGAAPSGRWRDSQRAGSVDPRTSGAVIEHPPDTWGLAARGALVEAGAPPFHFGITAKSEVWAENIPRLYAQAAAAQWDPATAIDWNDAVALPFDVESAVVQVMTYLIENETAALLVPAKFLAQIHPHFREAMQLLAIQVADEARHIDVFTRRATLHRDELGLSTVSGQASLKTLLDEPDFTLASFLLSVLGEGTFLNLLWFLEQHAPDPITRRITHLAAQDESRHVAFGMGHMQYQIARDPMTRERLGSAISRRYDALAQTSGLNEEVFDSLVILAAGAWTPGAIAEGFSKVQRLTEEMDLGRQARLVKLGFSEDEAASLSSLHTRNFM
jgi:hypothetical protein